MGPESYRRGAGRSSACVGRPWYESDAVRDRRWDFLYDRQRQPVKAYVLERFAEELAEELRAWPPPFDTDLDARAGLGIQLVDGIARLARVDWRARGLEGFGKPDGFLERQVDRWLAHLARNDCRYLPGTEATAAWLRDHIPSTYEPGIIHGDYQFANVMFAHGAPARLAAIVDWEMTTIGDPLLDLGWVTNGWPREGEDASQRGYVDMVGMPPRGALLDHYERVSGRSTADIDYYEILARFKLAIVLEAQYARYKSGGADNPKMEAFGPITIDLMSRAAGHAAAVG